MSIILLVENNRHEADLVRRVCKAIDRTKELIHVTDGAEALDYLHCRGAYEARDREKEPSLILMNSDMPTAHPFETLRELRTHKKTRAVPVILMTSSQKEFEDARAYEYGANSYTIKPQDYEGYLRLLKGTIEYWFGIVNPPPVEKC